MLNVLSFNQKPMHCGPAVLKMILQFFGVEKEEGELATLVRCSEDTGTRGEDIAQGARDLGFTAEVKDNSEISDIETLVNVEKIPVIVSWFLRDDTHFCVVVKIDKEDIYLQDPLLGYVRAIRREIFQRVWFDFEGQYMVNKDDLILRRMIIIRKK